MIPVWLAAFPSSVPDTDTWPVVLLAAITICLCVLVHYFFLWDMISRLSRRSMHTLVVICGTVLGLIAAHLIEIALFALSLFALVEIWETDIGGLAGQTEMIDAQGWYYYSAMVYTTVGFGDIVPTGPLRIFTACEALTGFVLITWSASFTFLVMQTRWKSKISSMGISPP